MPVNFLTSSQVYAISAKREKINWTLNSKFEMDKYIKKLPRLYLYLTAELNLRKWEPNKEEIKEKKKQNSDSKKVFSTFL